MTLPYGCRSGKYYYQRHYEGEFTRWTAIGVANLKHPDITSLGYHIWRQQLRCALWRMKYFCTILNKDSDVQYISCTWSKSNHVPKIKEEKKIMSNLPTSNMFWWSNIPSFVSSGTPNPWCKWNYFAILNPQMSCLFLTDAGKLPPEVNFLSVYSLFFKPKKLLSYKCHKVFTFIQVFFRLNRLCL